MVPTIAKAPTSKQVNHSCERRCDSSISDQGRQQEDRHEADHAHERLAEEHAPAEGASDLGAGGLERDHSAPSDGMMLVAMTSGESLNGTRLSRGTMAE